jgi:hypothetical protein
LIDASDGDSVASASLVERHAGQLSESEEALSGKGE